MFLAAPSATLTAPPSLTSRVGQVDLDPLSPVWKTLALAPYFAPLHLSHFGLDWLTSQTRYVRGVVPLGRDKARCLAVRFLIPPVENRACGRVGHQRVALAGTFPMAPLQTARESFDLKQLSSGLLRAPLA